MLKKFDERPLASNPDWDVWRLRAQRARVSNLAEVAGYGRTWKLGTPQDQQTRSVYPQRGWMRFLEHEVSAGNWKKFSKPLIIQFSASSIS